MKKELEQFDFEGGEEIKKYKKAKKEQETVLGLADDDVELGEDVFGGEEKESIVVLETEPFEENLPYEPFDPKEELQKINEFSPEKENLPHVEKVRIKKERLAEFKKLWLWQKRGITELIQKVRERVVENPDTDFQKLFSFVRHDAGTHKLNKDVIRQFRFVILEYENKHKAVEKYYKEYSTPEGLFDVCFGRKPNGKVEVIKGPMTLHFKIFNEDDYILAYSWGSVGQSDESLDLTVAEIEEAKVSLGVALGGAGVKELRGALTTENMSHSYHKTINGRSEILDTRTHEEQHVFDRLFKPIELDLERSKVLRRVMENAKNQEVVKQKFLHEVVRFERKVMNIDSMARDEVLAYYAEGRKHKDIYWILAESGSYNFQEHYKKDIASLVDQISNDLRLGRAKYSLYKPLAIDGWIIQYWVDKVFGEEYKKDLKKWTDAIGVLEKKGYGRQEILHLFYQASVNNWPNIARRMKEKK